MDKKIIFFIRSLEAGGAERQLVVIAKGLAQLGYDIKVLTFYDGGFYAEELKAGGVKLLSLHKKGRWDVFPFLWKFVRTLRKQRPDVIYSFLGTPNILAVLIRLFVPFIRVVWGVRASNVDLDRYDWLSRLNYSIESWLSVFAHRIVSNSFAGRDYAIANGFSCRNISVIHNGIDTDRFCPDKISGQNLRKKWNIPVGCKLVILAGRIDPMKGHETFLHMAAIVTKQMPNIRFVCVGSGDDAYEKILQRLSLDLQLNDVLIWAGNYRDMTSVYNAANVMISSSSYGEGFSNVIGESMACGTPCIVTDVGDSALIVGNPEWVVPPDNSEALAKALMKLMLLDEQALVRISETVRKRIIAEFGIDKLIKKTEKALVCSLT